MKPIPLYFRAYCFVLGHKKPCGMASVKAPPEADYCMALTVGWRRATLAVDKVVRSINLARDTGALAAGIFNIIDL